MIRLTVQREHLDDHVDVLTKIFESVEEAAWWLVQDGKFREPRTRLVLWERVGR